MFFTRWFGLCSQCSRVASRCELGWITRTGQSRRKYADFTGVQRLATSIVPKRNSHYDLGNLYNNISVQRYLQKLMEEHRFISRKLQHEHLSDPDRKALLKKHAELQSLADVSGSIEQAQKDLEEVLSLLHTSAKDEDEHLIQLLKEEEAQICSNILALRKDLIKALVPIDPLDSSDVVLEVVSGRTTGGGLHHAAVRVTGNNVYRHLKHEGGTHRVQKIPEIGLSSRMQRIHTGTMTVIILPQPVEFDVHIDPKDLRIDTLRSRGPGGQGVNTTDSAVRIVHLPTGITAECQQTRSQLQNRDTAMRVLRARLVQCMMSKETEQRHTARKQQVGTRSQAERIRTYNFSQDRVTDHRTGYTTKDIKEFMKGGKELEDLVSDLLEHSEKEAVMEAVETSICLT
ncbi:peptide chain release factor 1, mitochondrial isoform X2 [Fundulus heteroclitus]|uniref:peptide chain release factor 1, mitochondrial isoform X2 n=1 Tax=Fundulus heteroclitus TaxID=8078 RepID=UPI00165C1854|nr:peptide chain release factor 1, mitochondrial isoform X2 [Fundulus heteroclitus]